MLKIAAPASHIIATFLYDVFQRDVVYQFLNTKRAKEILRSIPENSKKYLPYQTVKVAYDYTNEYIINGTKIVYDGFCSFPFFFGRISAKYRKILLCFLFSRLQSI